MSRVAIGTYLREDQFGVYGILDLMTVQAREPIGQQI